MRELQVEIQCVAQERDISKECFDRWRSTALKILGRDGRMKICARIESRSPNDSRPRCFVSCGTSARSRSCAWSGTHKSRRVVQDQD